MNRKFKIKVVGHQLKNQVVAVAGDIVDESQLLGNADQLVKGKFIEEVESTDADDSKNQKNNANNKPVQTPAEKLATAKTAHANALKVFTALTDKSSADDTKKATDKLKGAIGKLKSLGEDVTELEKVFAPKADTRTPAEILADTKKEYTSLLAEKEALPQDAGMSTVKPLVSKIAALKAQLTEAGVKFTDEGVIVEE